MKRKIIKLAEKTLVVSLPTAWLQTQGLHKGDEVDVSIDDYKLVLTPPQQVLGHQSATLNLKGVTERVLRWQISSLHKQGYDEIIVTNYTDEHYDIIEDLIKNLFVGFIIKDKTALRVVVGQVAAVDSSEFDATLRRAFRQLQAMGEELYTAFKEKDSELLASQLNQEQQNNKLTNFCERLLNKTLKEKEKGHFWYVIAWNLEKLADVYKYIFLAYENNPDCSDEVLELLKEVVSYVDDYYKLLYSFSSVKLVELNKEKELLEQKCFAFLKEGKDVLLTHYLHLLILQTTDLSASIIALSTW